MRHDAGKQTLSVTTHREDWEYSRDEPRDPYNTLTTDVERSNENCHDADRRELDNG
jgi:hypothetical protein